MEVRVTTVEVPAVDVRSMRKRLGLSQASFAAKFGFQTATVRNWEQGRTRPDGPARILLAVIERHPEAVEDAVRREMVGVGNYGAGDENRTRNQQPGRLAVPNHCLTPDTKPLRADNSSIKDEAMGLAYSWRPVVYTGHF